MTGRRTRGATAHERSIRYIKEESILRPKSPESTEENWPCYVLTDATVYRSDGQTIANPLHVVLQGPMVVKGKLSVDDEDKVAVSNLVNPATRTAYIEIRGSDRYSIGYKPAVFWMSGAAGWFEIEPSPEYEAMYREVQDAITLYYSVILVYEDYLKLCNERKKKKRAAPRPPTLDQILFKYAMTLGNGILRDEAEAKCHKWAQFLIAHFSKGLDIENGDDTLFAHWMRGKHPELTQKIKDASAGLLPPEPIPPAPEPPRSDPSIGQQRRRLSKTSARSSEDIDMTDLDSAQASDVPKPKSRLVSNTPVPLPSYSQYPTKQPPVSQSPAPKESSPLVDSEPFSVIDRLIEVFKEEVTDKNMDMTKAATTRFSQAIWYRCRLRQYATANAIMEYYSQELLSAIPVEWRQSPFYKWLQEKALQPRILPEGLTIDDILGQLVRRARKPKQQTNANTPVNGSTASPALEPRNRARKAPKDLDEETEEPQPQGKRPLVTVPRRSGKGAVLRPPTSKKRPASEMEYEDEDDDDSVNGVRPGPGTGRKVAKRNRGIIDDDETDETNEYSDADTGDLLPASNQVPKEAVRVVVHSERLPTMSPSGPDGTWICEQEDCGYIVREAKDQVGQELIQKHFEWHQSQVEKISLAVAESRGQMPINHLLSKLQEIGKKKLLKKRGSLPNGEPLLPPIKRKVVI